MNRQREEVQENKQKYLYYLVWLLNNWYANVGHNVKNEILPLLVTLNKSIIFLSYNSPNCHIEQLALMCLPFLL